MTKQPHPARRARRTLLGGHRGLIVLLLAGGVIAAAGAVALDRHLVAKRRREVAASIPAPDRSALAAPRVQDWLPTPLAPGTLAPPFCLVDVRTGERVNLAETCGPRPVVLLLSSFG
jgi:hypothetical protein